MYLDSKEFEYQLYFEYNRKGHAYGMHVILMDLTKVYN